MHALNTDFSVRVGSPLNVAHLCMLGLSVQGSMKRGLARMLQTRVICHSTCSLLNFLFRINSHRVIRCCKFKQLLHYDALSWFFKWIFKWRAKVPLAWASKDAVKIFHKSHFAIGSTVGLVKRFGIELDYKQTGASACFVQ